MTHKTNVRPAARIVLAGLLATACALARAALPATHAGALDPTFNAGAPLIRSLSAKEDFISSVLLGPDGAILTAGWAKDPAGVANFGYISRYRPDGSLDAGYADAGTHHFGNTGATTVPSFLVALPGGKTMAAGYTYPAAASPAYRAWLGRLNADGSFDATYGEQGEHSVACSPNPLCYYVAAALQAGGQLIVLGSTYDTNGALRRAIVDGYKPDHSVDAAFGVAGRVVLPSSLGNFEPYGIAIDSAGRIVVSGQTNNPGSTPDDGIVVRLLPDGALDPGFGTGGVVRLKIANLSTDFRGVAIQADGKIVLCATTYDPAPSDGNYMGRVVRLAVDGNLDPSFGVQGVASVVAAYGSAIGLQSDGRIVYSGDSGLKARSNMAVVARVMPDGTPDVSFGSAGLVYPPSTGWSNLIVMAVGADDRVVLAGEATINGYWDSMIVRLIGTETTTSVTEFYNSTLNHYFITANPDEATAIDNGAAGPGWSRTGEAWKSGGPNRVCRFYGSPDLDPATGQRRGPNGHFYTISEEECALVKTDAGWKFESYDFSGWKPAANGSCAAGTRAVKRAYNNRFAVNDSNHRYATSDAVYNAMLAAGWTGEGTVYCANL